MRIYRLFRTGRDPSDFKYTRLFGGRWNAPGTAMLYAAGSLSLACLEVLAHLDKTEWPDEYLSAWTEVDVSASHMALAGLNDPLHTQSVGNRWIREGKELALRVPSVIVPQGSYYDSNILLNPNLSDFHGLEWTVAGPFEFDKRFFLTTL